MDVSEHLVERDVLRGNPAYPGEVAESLEQISGKDIPDGGCGERVEEEAFTAETTAATNTGICLRVQSVEKSASDQVSGPDWNRICKSLSLCPCQDELTHRRRLYQEATGNTTDGESNELGGHNNHPLV